MQVTCIRLSPKIELFYGLFYNSGKFYLPLNANINKCYFLKVIQNENEYISYLNKVYF